MFPTIDKRKTGTNLRRIMDKRGLTVKDVQQYLGLGSVRLVGCEKKLEVLEEKRNILLTELDTQIKVSNATTFIEIA